MSAEAGIKKRSSSRIKQSKRQPESSEPKSNTEVQRNKIPDPNSEILSKFHSIFSELNYEYEMISLTNVFFQDQVMKKFYEFYPEFICIDILCDLPELNKVLVLFIAVDTNGHCEIISVGLIKRGSEQGFSWICDKFKDHNPSWTDIELILSDDSFDREILKAVFPGKIIFPSFFHCMRAFKNDLSNQGTAVNQDINETLLLFEKLMFVTTESEYGELLNQMKQINSKIFNFFKKKWHTKRDLWTLGLHTDSRIFLKSFNKFLVSVRRKVKPVISSQETLEKVIRILHTLINKLRKEWFQQITKMLHSPASSYLKVQVMEKYSTFITPFGTELVYEQLKKSENIKSIQKVESQFYFKVDGAQASSSSCSCNFHKSMKLPCCHILSVRKHLFLPQFIQTIRPSWIFASYCENFFTLYSFFLLHQGEPKADEMRHRYEEFVRTSHELWGLIFNCAPNVSQERLEIYQNILKAWKNDFEIEIIRHAKQNDSNDSLTDCAESQGNNQLESFTELYGMSVEDIIDSEIELLDLPFSPDDNFDGIDI